MTKTKRQLRAEAVERLREMQYVDDYGDWVEAIAEIVKGTDKSNIGDYGMWESLLDLLTDDEPTVNNVTSLLERAGVYRDADYEAFDNDVVRAAEKLGLMPEFKYHHQKHSWLLSESASLSDAFGILGDAEETQEVRASSSRCEPDSREKLEADLKTELMAFGGYCANSLHHQMENADTYFDDFIALLNRQAAITHSIDAWNIERLERERDEWKTKCETREVAYKQADAERKRYSEQIDELVKQRNRAESNAKTQRNNFDQATTAREHWQKKARAVEAERDEWKAKAEQAELRGNDRVTNLEWYYEHDSDFAWKVDNWAWDAGGFSTSQPLDEIPWTHPKMREWLMAPHDDAHSKPQSKTEPILTEQPELLSDEADSREKLEADIDRWAHSFNVADERHHSTRFYEDLRGCMIGIAERQAAITERELAESARSGCDICGNDYRRQRDELQAKVDGLTAELDRYRTDMPALYQIKEMDCQLQQARKERDELTAEKNALEAELRMARGEAKTAFHNCEAAKLKAEKLIAEYRERLEKPIEDSWRREIESAKSQADYYNGECEKMRAVIADMRKLAEMRKHYTLVEADDGR